MSEKQKLELEGKGIRVVPWAQFIITVVILVFGIGSAWGFALNEVANIKKAVADQQIQIAELQIQQAKTDIRFREIQYNLMSLFDYQKITYKKITE